MLPDLRFAIGAVLAGALLIVTAFGLAATVRIAHHKSAPHKSAPPLEGSRLLAYAEPADAALERPVAALELASPAEPARPIASDIPVRANIVATIPAAPAADAAPEPTPAETEPREPGEPIAALPPAAEEKVAPALEPLHTATLAPPARMPAAKAKSAGRKFAKKRKRVRIMVERPAAHTGYPVLNVPAIERQFLRNERAVIVD